MEILKRSFKENKSNSPSNEYLFNRDGGKDKKRSNRRNDFDKNFLNMSEIRRGISPSYDMKISQSDSTVRI